MKLIEKCDVNEGQLYPANAVISYGKTYIKDDEKPSGWYLNMLTPFIRYGSYLDPKTFRTIEGKIRLTYMLRKHNNGRLGKLYYTYKVWLPVK